MRRKNDISITVHHVTKVTIYIYGLNISTILHTHMHTPTVFGQDKQPEVICPPVN